MASAIWKPYRIDDGAAPAALAAVNISAFLHRWWLICDSGILLSALRMPAPASMQAVVSQSPTIFFGKTRTVE
jgi:hypothetical protein